MSPVEQFIRTFIMFIHIHTNYTTIGTQYIGEHQNWECLSWNDWICPVFLSCQARTIHDALGSSRLGTCGEIPSVSMVIWRGFSLGIPSGKRLHNYGKSPFSMGNPLYMAIFNSYVSHYQRVTPMKLAIEISLAKIWGLPPCVVPPEIWSYPVVDGGIVFGAMGTVSV